MRQYNEKFRLLLVLLLVLVPAGCKVGFDYDALNLSAGDVIDYGAMARENKISAGTAIYGVLRSGVGSDSDRQLTHELGDITRTLNNIKALPQKSSDVDAWVQNIESDLSSNISGKVSGAMRSATGAESLAREMESYVKKGSDFRTKIESVENNMQKLPAGSEFKRQSEKLIKNFEHLYQMGVVYAMAKPQDEANAQANIVKGALERLNRKIDEEPMFGNIADRSPVRVALDTASGKLGIVSNMIMLMMTPNVVNAGLTSALVDLGAGLTSLKTACPAGVFIDAQIKAEVDSIIADAERAKNELTKIATSFSGYEKGMKESSDISLEVLIKRGFSGEVGASVSAYKLSRETEVARFMRFLSKNKVVVLKKDEASEEFIKALGVAVEKNNAELYELSVHNVYGFNAANLLKSKQLFGMNDSDYEGYVSSMAKKANEQKSQNGELSVVFVVFVDDLGAEFDLSGLKENLSLGNSRVVIVTDSPSNIKGTNAFISTGLDLMSGYFVAKATIEDLDPAQNAGLLAEPLVKMYYGLKSRPDQMNLVSLPEAAKEMLLRLRSNAHPLSNDIDNAAKDALGASKDKIPVELVTNSAVLASTLSQVESQIDANRYYFLEKGRGTRDNLEENAQMRMTREQNRILNETNAEKNERKAKKQFLRSIYKGYLTELQKAPPKPDVSGLVNNYKDVIAKVRDKVIFTLNSMRNLLDNDLCAFKNQDELVTAKPGFDGGQVSFSESVGMQKFNDGLVKNPMRLFNITPDGQVIAPAAPTSEERAAIGLNCFLTGRRKGKPNDGQLVLKDKVQAISIEVMKVCQDAKDLASDMTPTDLAQFSQKHLALRERLKGNTFGDPGLGILPAVNHNYWKDVLSIGKIPKMGSPAALAGIRYGQEFDVQGQLLPYPVDFSNPSLLPDLIGAGYGAPELPGHFIATTRYNRTAKQCIPRAGASYTYFTARAPRMLPADYSVINAYGLSLQKAHGLGLKLRGEDGIPAGKPAWKDDFPHRDFIKLNKRIWAWFLSRIVGKIPTGIAYGPLENELYVQQNVNMVPTDLFSNKEVFIDVLFEETKKFVQDSNRSLIALYALKVLENYLKMGEALYSLKPVDYKAFLNQVPATPLSTFFNEIETILAAQTDIVHIKAGTQLQVDAWRRAFMSPAIEAGLLALIAPAPVAGADAKLDQAGNSKWGYLRSKAVDIEALRLKLIQQITVI